MRSTGCRHLFCQQCWHGYLSAAIEAGPSVLDLRCPLPDCTAAVRLSQLHTLQLAASLVTHAGQYVCIWRPSKMQAEALVRATRPNMFVLQHAFAYRLHP